jgi:hypothetical protein
MFHEGYARLPISRDPSLRVCLAALGLGKRHDSGRTSDQIVSILAREPRSRSNDGPHAMRQSSPRHSKARLALSRRKVRSTPARADLDAPAAPPRLQGSLLAAEAASRPGLELLSKAAAAWVDRGDAGPLLRAVARALDADGVPKAWAVVDWVACLALLANARQRREAGWPVELDARLEGLLRAVLRFARPDGSPVFATGETRSDTGDVLRFWAENLADPALERVVDDWFPPSGRRSGRRSAPPLPADARPDRPLAVLRPDWTPRGDFLAIDQRNREEPTQLELVGLGQRWLGPAWPSEATSLPRPTLWTTGAYADAAEWTFRRGTTRVTRTVVLLRGEQLAIVADEVTTTEPDCALRVALAPGVEAEAIAENRGLKLAARQSAARVLPVALPSLPYETDRGSFRPEGSELVLRQRNAGRRCWLPLLVSWRPDRDRRPTRWRVLTVSEKWTICPPDVAFAVRVSWGGESLVIYRSLARPKHRAFLGHQTRARFLVGWFTKDGTVDPLLTVPTEE